MAIVSILALAAAVVHAAAVSSGFNYASTNSNNAPRMQADFEAQFSRAKTLQGTNSEFSSARLYTMIQAGTTNDPIQAIPAAISTKTTLLLGLWASIDQATFNNEIAALKSAISKYGSDFASLVVGISVGSEDLYRNSPTGIMNKAGIGQDPSVLVDYIKQVKAAVSGTPLSNAQIGHVDTWTAWVNGSNSAVISECQFLGMDSYPYFETTVANSIDNANATFWQSYDNTVGVSGGKEVWITETGWPTAGPNSGQAVASVANAESYWQQVACSLLGRHNTWWYTIQDADPTVPSPTFGIVGAQLSSAPAYNLTCSAVPPTTKSSGTGNGNGTSTGSGSSSGSGSASGTGIPGGASGSRGGSGGGVGSSSGGSSSGGAASGGSGASSGNSTVSSGSPGHNPQPQSSTNQAAGTLAPGSAMIAGFAAVLVLAASI